MSKEEKVTRESGDDYCNGCWMLSNRKSKEGVWMSFMAGQEAREALHESEVMKRRPAQSRKVCYRGKLGLPTLKLLSQIRR